VTLKGLVPRLIAISLDAASWQFADVVFCEIRASRLKKVVDESSVDATIEELLEVAAKVIYNASGVLPGFDAHAGARVVPIVARILGALDPNRAEEEAVERALWRLPPKRLV